MQHTPMTLDEFETWLDRCGCDLERWPAAEASAARQLLDTSQPASRLMADARAIEHLLDDAFPVSVATTGAVRQRILASIERDTARPRPFAWLWQSPRALRPLAIAAALIPLCVGFAIGLGYQRGVSDELASDVSLFAFAAYEEIPNGDQ